MSDNQDYMEGEQAYNYEQDNYDDYWNNEPLYSNPSKDKSYDVCDLDQITKNIYDDNNFKMAITSLSSSWTLMLYYFCDFHQNELYNVIDKEGTGRKMIRYDNNYVPTVKEGVCMVCCDVQNLVYNNCEHSFCYNCWKDYLESSHRDRNNYELFPMCPWEGCFFRTNLLLMEKIWSIYPLEKKFFQKLLCLKYSQLSGKVKLCNRQGCNNAISINMATQRTLTCKCGNKICRICSEKKHFPLDCGDLKTWKKIVSDLDQQWINEIVTQPCPMCKTPIDKNGGCIHMTCRCGHSFCWICLKVWKGHNNYGECSSVKKEDHEKKLAAEQEKRKKDEGYYNVRFEEAKSEIERVENILRRVESLELKNVQQQLNKCYILTKDLSWLYDVKEFVLEGMALLKTAHVYIFFQREGFQLLSAETKVLWKIVSSLDDFLTDKSKLFTKTKKRLRDQNDGTDVDGDILINEVKNKYFSDIEFSQQLMNQGKKIYEVIEEGAFMSIKK